MTEKFRSYVQGIRDTVRELGDKIPDGMEEGDEAPVMESSRIRRKENATS